MPVKQTYLRSSKESRFEVVTYNRPAWAVLAESLHERIFGTRCCRNDAPRWMFSLSHFLLARYPDGRQIDTVALTNDEAYGAAVALGLDLESAWAHEVSFQLEDCVEQGAMRYATHLAELLYERGFDQKGEPLTEEDYLNA